MVIIMFPHTEELRRQARSRGKDIVMFGHTHKPYLDTEDGLRS